MFQVDKFHEIKKLPHYRDNHNISILASNVLISVNISCSPDYCVNLITDTKLETIKKRQAQFKIRIVSLLN